MVRLVGLQALLAGAVALLLSGLGGRSAALSFAAGGGIHILGGALMGLIALRKTPGGDPRGALGMLVIGEVAKFVFTILLFTTALVAFEVRAGYMLAGYLLTTIGYWLILLKG